MAYLAFENDVPVSSDNGNDVIDDIRKNLMAMRDAVQMGAVASWNYSKTDGTGTAEQPQYIFYKNGTDWLRATLTWGTTGGADGNVSVALWEFSSNSGGAYDSMGTETIAFDVDANVVSTTWS
ncbi:MAG: hypothetical protein ACI9DH_000547 [Halioglobus sp.]|jgi:hypothetical protein